MAAWQTVKSNDATRSAALLKVHLVMNWTMRRSGVISVMAFFERCNFEPGRLDDRRTAMASRARGSAPNRSMSLGTSPAIVARTKPPPT